jgi:hypothetical protein
MTGLLGPSEILRRGFLFARILTGCNEGAMAAVADAASGLARHPSGNDPKHAGILFMTNVRRRALKFPARCELPAPLDALHTEPEPQRSARVLHGLGGTKPSHIGRVLGMPEKSLPHVDESTFPPGLLAAIAPDPASEARLIEMASSFGHAKSGFARLARNPSTIAVTAGFLLLVLVLVWHLTGRAGVFPEEAIELAAQARRADPSQFSPVDIRAGAVSDWFAMNGIDGVNIPPPFAEFSAVGVRSFKSGDHLIAQVAVLNNDRRYYFLAFPAEPFGMKWLPEGVWQTTTNRDHAIGLRREGSMCFLVTTSGAAEALESTLRTSPRSSS